MEGASGLGTRKQGRGGVLILHVSDLHFDQRAFEATAQLAQKLSADVCISGDLLATGPNAPDLCHQIDWVSRWLRKQTFKLFVCSGNHDGDPAAPVFARWLRQVSVKDRVVVDGQKARSTCGMVISCMPYLSTFADPRSEVLVAGADVIVTHEPPSGSPTAFTRTRVDLGNPDLTAFLDGALTAPDAVLCGHVHEPLKHEARLGPTWISNPATVLNEELRAAVLHRNAVGVTLESVSVPLRTMRPRRVPRRPSATFAECSQTSALTTLSSSPSAAEKTA